MFRVYEAFLERLSDSIDERDLLRAMAMLAHAFDLPNIAYLSIPARNMTKPRLISNYPNGWVSHYLDNSYERIDPVIALAKCSDAPFCWGADFRCEIAAASHSRFFDEAAEFGICCGLTIPIHDRRGGVAALTFAADEADPAIRRAVDQYEHAFQLAATNFHIRARRILSSIHEVDGICLTPREFECLQWAAQGKSGRDIGHILGITRRTAAFHLDNARRKLGVRTIAQAVARLAASPSFIN